MHKQVAAELVAGEAGHTLFDFVDDASLASLKLQAQVSQRVWLAGLVCSVGCFRPSRSGGCWMDGPP